MPGGCRARGAFDDKKPAVLANLRASNVNREMITPGAIWIYGGRESNGRSPVLHKSSGESLACGRGGSECLVLQYPPDY